MQYYPDEYDPDYDDIPPWDDEELEEEEGDEDEYEDWRD